jgi:hypothetical protein
MALEEAIEVLKISASVAEVIPVLGTPIKAAIEATSNILEFAKVRAWSRRQVERTELRPQFSRSKLKKTKKRQQPSRNRRPAGSSCS